MFSATIHSVAPSPIVYPVEPVCWHRYCRVGEKPLALLVLKLISMNDSTQERAHGGINAVTSGDRPSPAAGVVAAEAVVVGVGVGAALAESVWCRVAQTKSSSFALEGAMLEGLKNIYLYGDDHMARG